MVEREIDPVRIWTEIVVDASEMKIVVDVSKTETVVNASELETLSLNCYHLGYERVFGGVEKTLLPWSRRTPCYHIGRVF